MKRVSFGLSVAATQLTRILTALALYRLHGIACLRARQAIKRG